METSSALGTLGNSNGIIAQSEQRMGLSSVRGRFTSGRGISSGWSSSGSEGRGNGGFNTFLRTENRTPPLKDLNPGKRFGTTLSQSAAASKEEFDFTAEN
jgi:hypothetical protein